MEGAPAADFRHSCRTDKKENQIYKDIQSGAVAKSYTVRGRAS
jgi:hypothetical protein